MKKHGIGSRLLALLLALAMVLPMMPLRASAAKGDLANVDTGLVGNTIDTNDTISLPIQILDYDSDGMLFEYAESNDILSASNFGATWSVDFASMSAIGSVTTSMYGDFWGYTSETLNTSNGYASFMRATWAANSSQGPHTFNGSRAGTIMPNDLGGMAMDNVRYLVLVYRTNVSNAKIGFFVERESADRNNTNNRVGDFDLPTSTTNWTYAVYDLKQGNLANTWTSYGGANAIWTTLPMDSSGEYIDIAHVALFADPDKAKAFGEYALTDGSNRGDNRAFGLLRSSRNESGTDAFASIVDWDTSDTIVQLNTYNAKYDAYGNLIPNTVDFSTITSLGYTLLGTFAENGIANIGLLEDTLVNGKPVYKKEVVDYLALLLQSTLPLAERTSDGWKNYRYIDSELADNLRSLITGGLGTYPTGDKAAGLIGTWEQCQGNISTYYDAAYFLLNSIFIDNSYNIPQDEENNGEHYYDYLVLSAGYDKKTVTTENPTGDKVYVFDGGFSTSSDPAAAQMAIDYNRTTHTIQNTSAAGKAHFFYQWWTSTNTGDTTTLNPFLPITDKNTAEGQTKTPYYQDDGVINIKKTTQDTLVNRDYNFAMYSSGEFVYHADDELFFDFEGDDDVYLFINDTLVMDIGSAHSIDGVRFELNDYVEKAKAGELASDAQNKNLALVEGDTYNFDFFYMERHSYGSNMRINTNIKVTDPSMVTDKTAYVDGTQVEYGGIVNADSVVEYGFAISNSGSENLYNIGFTDADIGVTLDPENGLTITGDRVYSLDGTLLRKNNTEDRDKLVKELTAVLSGRNDDTGVVYDPITVTFADNQALKDFLATIKSDVALDSGGGLWRGSTVSFRGIGYKLSAEQVASGWFDNTVFTTATNKTKSKTLQSQDTMRVCVPSDPMYYQWADHKLEISISKLVTDITAAANQEGNTLAGKVSDLTAARVTNVVEVTKGGYAHDYAEVTVNSDFSLTVNYTTVGSHVFYVKVYYKVTATNWPSVIIPVVVNVTDVEDSVFVLDYGLKADLAENGGKELFKNDTVTVPGRATSHSVLAVGSDGAYSPNEITFTSAAKVEGTYGDFTTTDGNLLYTPKAFLEGLDTVQIAVNVYESDLKSPSKITGALDINNEVEMYKNVTVLPATVVYYEDDFPAITYIDQEKNTFTRLGSSSDKSQGVDQEENYGHDDTYANGSNTTESAGTLTTITIKQDGPVAKFTFKGTGFELISRTNAKDSATVEAMVFAGDVTTVTYDADTMTYKGDGEDPIRLIPVITEFDNGGNGGEESIYQVPVIRVDDLGEVVDGELTAKTYTVVISGTPAYDWDNVDWSKIDWDLPIEDQVDVIPTELYIDGLRIFQPLGATNENYDTDENGAVFQEIRDLIVDGSVAVAKYDGTNLSVSTGTTTWTENRNGAYYNGVYEDTDDIPVYEGNVVEDVNAYLLMGPNNEVYMDGTVMDAALAFYVTESGTGEHQLQIAVHAVDQGMFYSGVSTGMHAPIYYGVKNGDSYAWEPLATVYSATEQYYTIDYTKCPVVDGKYQVVIKVDIEGSEYANAMASYTSLKLTNMAVVSMEHEAATLRYNENGELEQWNGFAWVPVINEETGDVTPASNYPAFESLSKQMSVSVLSQTEPEPTDPEPTDPEPTDPEPTDPEPTDPEPTDPEPTDPEPTDPEPTEPEHSFTDVAEDAFYYEAMLWAVENGVTTGTTETTFSPERKVTRAEAVTFLWRAAGKPEPTADNPFVDVSESDFYYKAVLWAVENSITNGMDATHFGPLTECNRAQVVTFLYRAAGEPEITAAAHPFTDVTEDAFYYEAMLWAVENAITNGVSGTAFGPNEVCNRAQIVTFLYRAA